jgi:hypothetical protein
MDLCAPYRTYASGRRLNPRILQPHSLATARPGRRARHRGSGMSAVSRRAFLSAASAVAVVAGLPAGASVPAAPVPAIPRPLPTLADLKAWSERALAVLQKHWPENIYGEVFLSEGDSPHGLRIRCDCPGRSGRRPPAPSAVQPQSRSSRAGNRRRRSSPSARAGPSSRRSSGVSRLGVVLATRPYPATTDDHPAGEPACYSAVKGALAGSPATSELHHHQGRDHFAHCDFEGWTQHSLT